MFLELNSEGLVPLSPYTLYLYFIHKYKIAFLCKCLHSFKSPLQKTMVFFLKQKKATKVYLSVSPETRARAFPSSEHGLADLTGSAAALGKWVAPAVRFWASGGSTLLFFGLCHFAEPWCRDVFLI